MDGLWAAVLEALKERRVLAVDRQQEASPTLLRGERELSGGDEALLVGEREGDAVLEGPQRCRKPAKPTTMPFDPRWTDALWIAAVAIVVSFVATLYPARNATKILPVEALRYE